MTELSTTTLDLPEGGDLPEAGERSKIPRKVLMKSWWRFFWAFDLSFNWERMEALGFAWTMSPVLRWLNSKDEDYAAAMKRHLVFFNTGTVIGVPLVLGAAIGMEEARQPRSAESMKIALMGPLAGIGDTLTFALYNSIIFTLGASWALQGYAFGPIFVLLLMAVPYTILKWIQFDWGYRKTRELMGRLSSGVLERVTEGATVFGLIVLGGFIPSIVHMVTKLSYTQNLTVQGKPVESVVQVQTQLDALLPYMLPVLVTALAYVCLKRFRLSPLWVILILAVVGIGLGWLGWFANVLPPVPAAK